MGGWRTQGSRRRRCCRCRRLQAKRAWRRRRRRRSRPALRPWTNTASACSTCLGGLQENPKVFVGRPAGAAHYEAGPPRPIRDRPLAACSKGDPELPMWAQAVLPHPSLDAAAPGRCRPPVAGHLKWSCTACRPAPARRCRTARPQSRVGARPPPASAAACPAARASPVGGWGEQ